MIVTSAFKPAWWLRNPHLQTTYSYIFRSVADLEVRGERLELPDGDFLDLLWLDQGLPADAPLIILLHGLCGSGKSKYIKTQMRLYQQMGWRSVVMQCRGASHEPNRKLRSYHSGDTSDLNYFLHILALREPHSKKGMIGFSMGGNVVLKWLGENERQNSISAAIVVSVPYQLNLIADRMNQGFSRVYRDFLLNKLRKHFRRKLITKPNPEFLKKLDACRCFWTFDENITAPLCGFDSVHTYYHEASSRSYLGKITTPTLAIHAIDDPFMCPEAIPKLAELSPSITLEVSRYGGHLGFICGNIPGRPQFWLEKRIPDFFMKYMN